MCSLGATKKFSAQKKENKSGGGAGMMVGHEETLNTDNPEINRLIKNKCKFTKKHTLKQHTQGVEFNTVDIRE